MPLNALPLSSARGPHAACGWEFAAPSARVSRWNHIDELTGLVWQAPRLQVTPRGGIGVGAVEAPRGVLYHCYEFDDDGRITNCDCVIPTSQNHANIQQDLKELAARYASQGTQDPDIELLAQMLVRSYDPCISCSVH